MRRLAFQFVILLLVLHGCGLSNSNNDETEIILPDNDYNAEDFSNAIKSIEVIELQVDDNSMYNENADLRVSPNYYYFIDHSLHLMCYERATGKMLCSRNIMGRSSTECTYPLSTFIMNDDLVINDDCQLKMYDHNGKFCRMLGDANSGYVLPLGDGYICCDKQGNNIFDTDKCLILLDSVFNAVEFHFNIPEEYKPFGSIHVSNSSPDWYVINDTLRFIYQYTYRLHSFPGNKTYHFITSNPMPKSELRNAGKNMFDFTDRIRSKNYAGELFDLVENQDYIFFKYNIGATTTIFVLLSKRDKKVQCIKSPRDKWDTSLDVWAVMLCSQFLYSDGKYFYARAHRQAFDFLDKHKDILDTRQKAVYDTMQARLARSKHDDFNFYYKIEF